MFEDIDTARGELKRVDHLIYVTLKYTRTADVIKNVIKRLISAIDFAVMEILTNLKVKDMHKTAKERCDSLLKMFPRVKELKDYVRFYNLLRKIDRAEYTAKEEYRKNVTLVNSIMNVTTDVLMEFYDKTVEFVLFLEELTEKKKKR